MKFANGRVAAENRMGRAFEKDELQPASVALALQLGLGRFVRGKVDVKSSYGARSACNGKLLRRGSEAEEPAEATLVAGGLDDEDDPARAVRLPGTVTLRKSEEDEAQEWPMPARECFELAPVTFAKARAAFGMASQAYRAMLSHPFADVAGKPLWPTLGTMAGAGKSGASFFVSSDQRLIIKSCKPTEARALLEMMPSYLEHIAATPHTLLPRFCGLHFMADEYWIISENFFWSGHELHTRFDLKGSTHGRRASDKERLKGPRAVLKDLDWLGEKPSDFGVADARGKALLLDAVHHDAGFLAVQRLIDYSLLVGLSHDEPGGAGAHACHELRLSGGGSAVFGIVDVLVKYGAKKRAETFVMGTCRGGKDISCQPPLKYARRFANFMSYHVLDRPSAPPDKQDGLPAPILAHESMATFEAFSSDGSHDPADGLAELLPLEKSRAARAESAADAADSTGGHGIRSVVHSSTTWKLVCHWPDVCERLRAATGAHGAGDAGGAAGGGRDALWRAWCTLRAMDGGGGRSGARFWAAGATALKTVNAAEFGRLCECLPTLAEHVLGDGGGGGGGAAGTAGTLLCPFICAFELSHLTSHKRWRIIGFPLLDRCYGTIPLVPAPAAGDGYALAGRLYDLKGTQEARRARPGASVGKDEDLRAHLGKDGLTLPADAAGAIGKALARDTQLLFELGHLDYSLLLLPYEPEVQATVPAAAAATEDASAADAAGASAEVSPTLLMAREFAAEATLATTGGTQALRFRVAIIDYLAPFNRKKRAALAVKRSCFRPDLALKAIDTAPPGKYANRFKRFSGEVLGLA